MRITKSSFFYDEIQNADYEDPRRYRTVAFDNDSGNVITTSQEKMDSASVIPIRSSLEPSTDQSFKGKILCTKTSHNLKNEKSMICTLLRQCEIKNYFGKVIPLYNFLH